MKYKKNYCSITILIASFIFATAFKSIDNKESSTVKVLIITEWGSIKIKLYNETPLHRDNFVKLIREHYYDSLTFHRIIQDFVIQGGDPGSRNAKANAKIGNGGPGYTVPSEINQQLFHKKGALAASNNEEFDGLTKGSSGSQFYIVQGTVYTESMLKNTAIRITKTKLFNEIINRTENKQLLEKFQLFSKSEELDSLKTVNETIMAQVEKELPQTKLYAFSDEQIKAYTTVGGTPHLDNSYTVFGEVIEGIQVIDNIAKQNADRNGKPLQDIRMKIIIME